MFIQLSKLKSESKDFKPIFWFGLIACNVMAVLWTEEEPHKLNTFFAFNFSYFLSLFIILGAAKKKLILDVNSWILVFIIKIIFSFLIVKFCWAIPLIANDFLRTEQQSPLVTDANYYDYIAAEIVRNGVSKNFDLFFSTWLSFGVISYLVIIYKIFGISVLYVSLFNNILILLFSIALTATVTNFFKHQTTSRYWQVLKFSLLLPYESYYDATPSKEPLTLCFLYLSIYFISKLYVKKKQESHTQDILGFFISFLLIMFIRPNVGVMVLAIGGFILVRKLSIVKSVFAICFGLTALYFFLEFSVGFSLFTEALTNTQYLDNVREANIDLIAESSPLKSAIANSLNPTGIASTIFLAPLRLVVWILLPYPFIFPDIITLVQMPSLLSSDWNAYFRAPEVLCRVLSTLIIIYFLPFIFRPVFNSEVFKKVKSPFMFFLAIFLIITLIITTNNFVNGGRYRAVVEPMLLVLGVLGMHEYKYDIKYRFQFYLLLIVPASLLYLVTTFKSV